MFISRRRFEEELAKVRCEVEEKFYINHRFERIEHECHERLHQLETRLIALEDKAGVKPIGFREDK